MSLALEPALTRCALQRLARGQIVSENGMLRHRSDVLPPDMLSMLQALHWHGYVTLIASPAGPPAAALTVSGTQLLDWWDRQASTPHAASAPIGIPVVEVVHRDRLA